MDTARQKRKKDIDKALTFIQSSLPYPDPGGYESFLIQLVCNLLDEGNAAFKDGDWVQAIKDFSEGENVAQYATAEEIDVSKGLLESLYINRATAYYNLGHYESGVQDCDSALEVCEGSRRALYRKAMCLKELRQYREAYSCTMKSLMATPQSSQDKLINDLAQELSIYLGLETQNVHVTRELRGTSGNGFKTASGIGPVSDMDTLEDFELMGDDLDSLLDCFPNEPEATETHIQASLPDTVTYDASRKHSNKPLPMIQMTLPPGMPVPKPLVTHRLLPAPTPRLPHSVLPAPTPCLPPAFFDSAISELNSLDCFSAFGCTDAGDNGIKTPSLDTLDPLGRTSNGLDTLASVIGSASGSEPNTGVNPASLDMLDDLESLDDLLDSQPNVDEALREVDEPGANPDVDVENCFDDSLDESLDYFVAREMATGPTLVGTGISKIEMSAPDVLDSLDNLDTLDSFPVVDGARAALPGEVVREGGLDSLSDFSLPDTAADANTGRLSTMDETLAQHLHPKRQGTTRSSYTAVELPPRFAKLNQKKRNGYVSRTLNPLASSHDFMPACSTCFPREGKGIYSFVHKPGLAHSCRQDILLCRRKTGHDTEWTRIRTMPARNFFSGPFMLCKELMQSGDLGMCKFGENCTFAFNQLEIDVWTEERKGTFVRTLLFETQDADLVVTQLIQEHKGMFMILCQECFDSKPTRIISRRCKNDPTICSNVQACHIFDTHKCLVFAMKNTTESYSKIRPHMPQRQLDLCRHAFRPPKGCLWGDSCHYGHSIIEVQTWKVQRDTGITPEEIEEKSRKYLQEQQQNAAKQKLQRDPKPPSSVGAVGGAVSRTKAVGGDKSLNPNLRMKFACAQCWRDGLVSEPDKALKYCTAKASHSWIKERRVLLVKSLDRNKWVSVRSLPHAKNHPLQYEVCVQVLNQKKCNYTGNCSYAHSQEEREMWMYMKNNDIKDLQQMYEMWLSLTIQNRQSDEAILTQPPVVSEEKNIAMPTDYAVPLSGFHCHLCGRNSNSERQWQQHISSEKHKDRFFSCEGEDESLSWSYRFPGPGFAICPRLNSECPEGASCDYAHSSEELHEWIERRDFLRRKLAKARQDMLILPDDFDFGKYNFLLQDQTH